MSKEVLRQCRDALETAKNGLAWYRDRCPDAVDGSDDEASTEIDEAIAAADAALVAQVAPAEPAGWKCSECGAVSEVHGMTDDDNWCSSCGRCNGMQPLMLVAAPAPAQPLTNADYEKVLADHRRLVRELDVLLNGDNAGPGRAGSPEALLHLPAPSKILPPHGRNFVGFVTAYPVEAVQAREAMWTKRVAWLTEVLSIVREYPDFDDGGPMADLLDQAIAGNRPTLLDAIDHLSRGEMPKQAAPVAPAGWQPIETAPKDRTLVDLWMDGCRLPNCLWAEPGWGGDGCWSQMYAEASRYFQIDGEPTHWMPLPAAPHPAPEPNGERDWCTDPDNCRRCKAPLWDQTNHAHAGIPQGPQRAAKDNP